ncbi:MAG TPA: phosphodiester glycosidase family protein, partial [Longimicrobiaceae bacterium]|nr:phosphodiester glycosidase family protein [Longimicrobiaceae bacterium]
PRSALAVEAGGRWHTWWSTGRAPARWTEEAAALSRRVAWRPAQPGVEWGELRLSGRGEAWRLRVILVRLDPARVRLVLRDSTRAAGTRGAWTVAAAQREAVLALNGGQFRGADPWGWLVQGGRERQAPGSGPLSMALVADAAGGIRLVEVDSIPAVRERGGVVEALQSYPTLLEGDGEVPLPLRGEGDGVDLAHRDSRLAVGELRDGRILVALTRFEGLGGVLSELPFGLTIPEMAALMGALGCRKAVSLDGGISGQMWLRQADGGEHRWEGLRRVPLGVVVLPRGSPR